MPKAGTERVFLGYSRPALRPAAEWLVERFSVGGEADLGGVLVCVQGRRAAWHVLTLLIEACAARGVVLVPPTIGTPLDVLDVRGPGGAAEASDAQRLMAWCAALERVDRAALGALAPGRDLGAAGLRERLALADVLDATRHELSGQALSIAEAADLLGSPGKDVPDLERWRGAAVIEGEFERELAARGLTDDAGLRLGAVRAAQGARNNRSGPARRVVLVATPDLPRLVRLALEAHPPEAVLVIAEEKEAASFDELGTVRAGAFSTTDLSTGQVRIAGSPSWQSREVDRALREHAQGRPADGVLIGVPDAEVVPAVRARLEPLGVKVRDARGRALARTAPVRFLALVRSLLDTQHTRELAALVRHPDVFDWIDARIGGSLWAGSGWLRELDAALAASPPRALSRGWARSGITHDGACGEMAGLVGRLLGGLGGGAGADERRGAHEWAAHVRECLRRLYEGVAVGAEGSETDVSCRACEAIAERLDELAACGGEGRREGMSASEAIGLLLRLCEGERIPSPAQPGAVEMVGWLEVPFDDAPVCIVTGMNEGSVPRGAGGGTLLTGGSRRALEMPGSDAGLSRDAYLLNVLLRCHERVVVIAGRRSLAGDPLKPSRLLFTCGDEELPARVGLWTRASKERGASDRVAGASESGFRIMPRVDAARVTTMPVTAFKMYLASPYGFFLQRVLKLEEVGEPESELGPPTVGDLFHRAMKRFADGSARDATGVDDIRGAMLGALEGVPGEEFGPEPPGVVRVQAAQLRERIAGVAAMQAARRAEGWRIAHAEWRAREPVTLDCPGGKVLLTGSIDRIDERDGGREVAILDYKTSEKGVRPEGARSKSGAWLDLQLPLYRHLAAELWRGRAERPALSFGYINVPTRPGPAEVHAATWQEADLASADDAARAIAARVLRGDFFVLGDWPPDSGALGYLCGEGLIPPEARGEDGGEGISEAGEEGEA